MSKLLVLVFAASACLRPSPSNAEARHFTPICGIERVIEVALCTVMKHTLATIAVSSEIHDACHGPWLSQLRASQDSI